MGFVILLSLEKLQVLHQSYKIPTWMMKPKPRLFIMWMDDMVHSSFRIHTRGLLSSLSLLSSSSSRSGFRVRSFLPCIDSLMNFHVDDKGLFRCSSWMNFSSSVYDSSRTFISYIHPILNAQFSHPSTQGSVFFLLKFASFFSFLRIFIYLFICFHSYLYFFPFNQ